MSNLQFYLTTTKTTPLSKGVLVKKKKYILNKIQSHLVSILNYNMCLQECLQEEIVKRWCLSAKLFNNQVIEKGFLCILENLKSIYLKEKKIKNLFIF